MYFPLIFAGALHFHTNLFFVFCFTENLKILSLGRNSIKSLTGLVSLLCFSSENFKTI